MSLTLRASWTRDTVILLVRFIDVHRCLWSPYQRIDVCQSDKEVPVDVQPSDACCAPVTESVLDEADAEELAGLFKVLADPARLRLLSLVAAAAPGEACACDLEIGRAHV